MEPRKLERIARLTDLGLFPETAARLMRVPSPLVPDNLEGVEIGRYLRSLADYGRFKKRRRNREKYRIFWWRRLYIFQLLMFLGTLGFLRLTPFIGMLEGMNLTLPLPAALVAHPPWRTLALSLTVIFLPSVASKKEREAEACFALITHLRGGKAYLDQRCEALSPALLATLDSAHGFTSQSHVARQWARALEWELDMNKLTLDDRTLLLVPVVIFLSLVWVGLALVSPFYQLIG